MVPKTRVGFGMGFFPGIRDRDFFLFWARSKNPENLEKILKKSLVKHPKIRTIWIWIWKSVKNGQNFVFLRFSDHFPGCSDSEFLLISEFLSPEISQNSRDLCKIPGIRDYLGIFLVISRGRDFFVGSDIPRTN